MAIYRLQHRGNLILGLLLIVLGVGFLVDQFFGINLWHALWPLLFVGLGLVFFAGMLSGGKGAGGLAIPGSILTMLGLVFLYQNTFDHFESWAYAWALVAPTGVGIGLVIFGWWSERWELRRVGVVVMGVGLLIFLIGGAFFELLFTVFGMVTPGRFLLPLGLVLAGIFVLFGRNLLAALGTWLIGAPVSFGQDNKTNVPPKGTIVDAAPANQTPRTPTVADISVKQIVEPSNHVNPSGGGNANL